MKICSGCGVVAPEARDYCFVCDADFGPERLTVPDTHWQRMYFGCWQVRYECQACAQLSPVNHFVVDAPFACMHCGTERRIRIERWQELAEFARDVADTAANGFLRFPDAAIESSPFGQIGREHSYARDTKVLLSARASLGHPLCRQCRSPLEVAGVGDGRLQLDCRPCGTQEVFEIPRPARTIDGLAGVYAPAHVSGVALMEIEPKDGATALKCGHCGAALAVADGAHEVVTCSYCNGLSLLTPATRFRASKPNFVADWWWLFFDGPSALRRHIRAMDS